PLPVPSPFLSSQHGRPAGGRLAAGRGAAGPRGMAPQAQGAKRAFPGLSRKEVYSPAPPPLGRRTKSTRRHQKEKATPNGDREGALAVPGTNSVGMNF